MPPSPEMSPDWETPPGSALAPVRANLLVIGIAGASGSGKSCLAEGVAAACDAPILALDSYYKDLAHLPLDERARQNFDHPDSLDWPLLLHHLRQLLAGQTARIPHYDFASHTRSTETHLLSASHVLVLEGILALHHPEVRQHMGLTVFVELDSEECLRRRMERDIQQRGRTRDCVLRQYQDTVRPMDLQFVQPTAALAHLRVKGDAPLAQSIACVVKEARARRESTTFASATIVSGA